MRALPPLHPSDVDAAVLDLDHLPDQTAMSETQQTEYNLDDLQDLILQALNAPDFSERRAQCLAFFQEDAAQFERKVPSDRIIQVKRIFKLIKEIDLPAFKLLKSMRTAIGLLDAPYRDNLHENIKYIRAELKAGELTASAAHSLIYLMVLDQFRLTYLKYILQLPDKEANIISSYEKLVEQDPQAYYWLNCFVNSYPILLSDCDPAHWNLVSESEEDENPQAYLDYAWSIAYLQQSVIMLPALYQALKRTQERPD